MNALQNTKWIMDKAFYGKKPINFLRKELDALKNPNHDKSLLNHHMLCRKTFNVDNVLSNSLIISADDYYKLYINGKYVTQVLRRHIIFIIITIKSIYQSI